MSIEEGIKLHELIENNQLISYDTLPNQYKAAVDGGINLLEREGLLRRIITSVRNNCNVF